MSTTTVVTTIESTHDSETEIVTHEVTVRSVEGSPPVVVLHIVLDALTSIREEFKAELDKALEEGTDDHTDPE